MRLAEPNGKGQLVLITDELSSTRKDAVNGLIESLPGRIFDPVAKCWTVPDIRIVREILGNSGFSLPDSQESDLSLLSGVDTRLREYQKTGVSKIEQFGGRGLLAMDVGTGKTVTSLNYARIHPELRPAVIVAPSVVKYGWCDEIKHWMDREVVAKIDGRSPPYCRNASMVVLNYDILSAHTNYLLSMKPRLLILDEVQNIRTETAQRSVAAKKLATGIPKLIGLSGTPIENRPSEFWSFLSMCRPDIFRNRMDYLYRWCGPKRGARGIEFKGATNTAELNRILNDELMYRVKKRDVLKELPPITSSIVPFDSVNVDEIHDLERRLLRILVHGGSGLAQLDLTQQMRMATMRGKLDQTVEWIREFLEFDEKLVLFGYHHEFIDRIMSEFSGVAVKSDGRDNTKKKEESKQSFIRSPRVRLFVGQIDSAGVGLDGLQTVCSNVAFGELHWLSTRMDQAIGRVDRLGQRSDSIQVWYLVAKGTVDERMAQVIDQKRRVIGSVIDGEEDESVVLMNLLRMVA